MAETKKKEKKIRVDITLPESVLSKLESFAEDNHRTLSAEIAYLVRRQLYQDYWDCFEKNYYAWEEMTPEEYDKESKDILERSKRSIYQQDDLSILGMAHGALTFYAEKEGYIYRSMPGEWDAAAKDNARGPFDLFELADQAREMRARKIPDAEICEALGIPPLALDKFVKTFRLERPKPTRADLKFMRAFGKATKKG